VVLQGVSFDVQPGQVVAIVGANGAGKSTLMRTLSGVIAPAGGEATFANAPIRGRAPHRLVADGMLHVPEGRGTLTSLTVEDNLRLAYAARRVREPFAAAIEKVFARFPRLAERRTQLAGNLSGGEQQMLSLSRAIVAPPRLLLVDEPSLGLSPLLVKEVFAVLREFRAAGMSILIVEQNVRKALTLADHGYVLRQGRFAASGPADILLSDPHTLDQYLGATESRRLT
jgi:branched-chain amino acid transport system ATP-binding protein